MGLRYRRKVPAPPPSNENNSNALNRTVEPSVGHGKHQRLDDDAAVDNQVEHQPRQDTTTTSKRSNKNRSSNHRNGHELPHSDVPPTSTRKKKHKQLSRDVRPKTEALLVPDHAGAEDRSASPVPPVAPTASLSPVATVSPTSSKRASKKKAKRTVPGASVCVYGYGYPIGHEWQLTTGRSLSRIPPAHRLFSLPSFLLTLTLTCGVQ